MTADIGIGAALYRSDDGTLTGTFASVGDIYEITPPSLSRDTVDITKHSATGRWRQWASGLRDTGEMTLDVVFDPATGGDVYDWFADLTADTVAGLRIVFNDTWATRWEFLAYVTNVAPAVPLDDKRMLSITVKPDGVPAFAVPQAPTTVTAYDATSVAAGFVGATISIDAQNAAAATQYRVYRHTADSFAAATLLGTETLPDPQPMVYDNVVAVGTYYYWVTTLNPAGAESSPTASSTNPLTVTS